VFENFQERFLKLHRGLNKFSKILVLIFGEQYRYLKIARTTKKAYPLSLRGAFNVFFEGCQINIAPII
jgi:hypothetical protein